MKKTESSFKSVQVSMIGRFEECAGLDDQDSTCQKKYPAKA